MKRKTKRLLLILGLVATLAFALTACRSRGEVRVQEQQSLTLRVIEISHSHNP